MIKIRELEKTLSPDFTLKIGELTIEDGERVALIGPNGSGKSTLLRLLAGILTPDKGTIEISFPKASVGYEPQSPYVFKGTVLSNVRLGAKNADVSDVLRECRLEALRDKKADKLSGGEKQRVCFARMLAGNYGCLLLDEPLSAVDIDTGAALEDTLKNHCETNGTTLILSTHIPSEAFRVSTKVLIMNGGRIEEYAPAEALRSPQSEFGKKFISLWSL